MTCDICKHRVSLFEAQTIFGSRHNLCELCYARYAVPENVNKPKSDELEKAVHILYGWDEFETAPEELDATECEYCNHYCNKCVGVNDMWFY